MLRKFRTLFIAVNVSVLIVSCSDDDDTIENNDFVACTAILETGTVTPINDAEAHVYTSIVINATPEQVWEVLTDFTTMPNWSSTFQGLEGDITNGGQINALFLNQGQVLSFPHELTYEEGLRFGWSDEILTLPGIVDNHFYTIEPCGSETIFIQTDEFVGNNENVPAIGLANLLLMDYQTFNSELKAEVERRFN